MARTEINPAGFNLSMQNGRRYRFYNNNDKDNDNDNDKDSDTVKSHFKALGLYNFIRGLRWAYKRGEGGSYIRVGLKAE